MIDHTRISMEARLTRLESLEAIRDLVHLYAFNIRTGNQMQCDSLFTEDAIFETRDASPLDPDEGTTRTLLVGRAAIVEYISKGAASKARVYPSITNLLIELNGQQATASSLMSARVWPGGSQVNGAYRDSFRFDGRWRFQSRLYTIFPAASPT